MGNVLEEVWAEEGGIRLRISEGENGRCVVQVVDTTPGWPGTVVATATIARFRRERVARVMVLAEADHAADTIEQLARERDATAKTLELLLSAAAPQVVPCVDHPMLDVIYKAMAPESHFVRGSMVEDVTRESECIEFRDTTTGRHFEVIVRPIPDEEDRP